MESAKIHFLAVDMAYDKTFSTLVMSVPFWKYNRNITETSKRFNIYNGNPVGFNGNYNGFLIMC